MDTKKKYRSTTREMGRAPCRHWVDRWPRGTHRVTANTKEELETKKKKVEENIKILSDSFESFTVYLEGWKDDNGGSG